jgi:CheY-like chemotaxis protein
LTLSRRGVTNKEVVNLNDVIAAYLKSPEYEKLISYHPNIEVKSDFTKDLLNIIGSPLHLSKTIMNLVSNAAEATVEGGEIIISTENRSFESHGHGHAGMREGDYAAVVISDTGVGISSEDKDRMFEPFYTKKVMGRSGTGLGLAVVWSTVQDHDGYIDVMTEEGMGTTFTLYFPGTREALTGKKAEPSIDAYQGNGESILVVDDIKEQREIAGAILTKLGYDVSTVSSGEKAVEYIRENDVDLIVLDMIMAPGIDGLDTYRRILEIKPGQKAIIASGFSETTRVKEVQRLGAGQYLKKPYTTEGIGAALQSELRKEK